MKILQAGGDTGSTSIEIVVSLLILAAPLSAFSGVIFGAIALGEIRRSGGAKAGLGSAIFATTAWPILLLFLGFGQSHLSMGNGRRA